MTLPKPYPPVSAAVISTSSNIISLFNTNQEMYAPIIGPPTDNDMVCLCEAILTMLYSISLGSNTSCLLG